MTALDVVGFDQKSALALTRFAPKFMTRVCARGLRKLAVKRNAHQVLVAAVLDRRSEIDLWAEDNYDVTKHVERFIFDSDDRGSTHSLETLLYIRRTRRRGALKENARGASHSVGETPMWAETEALNVYQKLRRVRRALKEFFEENKKMTRILEHVTLIHEQARIEHSRIEALLGEVAGDSMATTLVCPRLFCVERFFLEALSSSVRMAVFLQPRGTSAQGGLFSDNAVGANATNPTNESIS
jgi:hypothetical protein